MSVEAQPVFWPEREDEVEEQLPGRWRPRIAQIRHRVGEYEVTRLIFDSSDETLTEGNT